MRFFTWILLPLPAVLLATCGPTSQPNAATPTAEASCMRQILAADDSLGSIRNQTCETRPLASTIQQYTAGMAALDFSDCPPAFTEAFRAHQAAWAAMVPVVERYPDWRGEMHALFDSLAHSADSAVFHIRLAAIWETWGQVEEAMR